MSDELSRGPLERIVGRLDCGCMLFCEHHGRDLIGTDEETGLAFCIECAADGFVGDLCTPFPYSCNALSDSANEWERQFMCAAHAEQHRAFCAEREPPNGWLSGSPPTE